MNPDEAEHDSYSFATQGQPQVDRISAHPAAAAAVPAHIHPESTACMAPPQLSNNAPSYPTRMSSRRPQGPESRPRDQDHLEKTAAHWHLTSPNPLMRSKSGNNGRDRVLDQGQMDIGDDLPPYTTHAYQQPPRKPLVDYVRNEWRADPRYHDSYQHMPISEDSEDPRWLNMFIARKVRKYVGVYLFLFLVGYGLWKTLSWTLSTPSRRMPIIPVTIRTRPEIVRFGNNQRPIFADMIQLETLDSTLVPQGEGSNGKRLVIVGDVHGCKDELVSLLERVEFNNETDHLILTGDFISKGPASPAVVDVARTMGASCVRGNHEDKILLTRRDINAVKLFIPSPAAHPLGGPQEYFDEDSFPIGDKITRELAGSFNQDQIDYIASCPVILRVGQIKGMGEVSVVHAGLTPGVHLEDQDPISVMNMRTMDTDSYYPSRSPDGEPWSSTWNKYQASLPHHHGSTVIYGHDSKRGLALERYSKGLDTGCVKGGELTALVVEDGDDYLDAKMETFSVPCGDYRVKKKETEPAETLSSAKFRRS